MNGIYLRGFPEFLMDFGRRLDLETATERKPRLSHIQALAEYGQRAPYPYNIITRILERLHLVSKVFAAQQQLTPSRHPKAFSVHAQSRLSFVVTRSFTAGAGQPRSSKFAAKIAPRLVRPLAHLERLKR